MNRSAFIAALLGAVGIGKAQQARWSVACIDGTNVRRCDPENNQCPVCGALAEPYKRPTYDSMLTNCRGTADPYVVQCDPQKAIPYGETERLTRCKRCNAAFWQDAQQ
jgi:uncharacterized protein with PIN domain